MAQKKSKKGWFLSDYAKELLLKQVTKFIADFVPDECKKKKYNSQMYKDIEYDLNEVLIRMALLNSASGLSNPDIK